jgi:ATP-dependent helicase/DNAse subunit B
VIKVLLEVIKKNPIKEKILLVENPAFGKIIIDRLCKATRGLINFRVQTIGGLAQEFANDFLNSRRLVPVPDGGGELLVQNILSTKGYYKKCLNMPSLPGALWASLQELRKANVMAGDLESLKEPPIEKNKALAKLLAKVEKELKRQSFVDSAEIFKVAINLLSKKKQSFLLLIPANVSFRGLEKEFFNKINCEKIDIPVNVSEDTLFPLDWRDIRQPPIHPIVAPNSSKKQLRQKSKTYITKYFDTEILEIVREIKAKKARFEDIEIALSNTAQQASTTISILDTYKVPWHTTFSLSISEFRLGRLAQNILNWIINGFPASGLISMLESGEARLFPPQKGENNNNEIPGPLKTATIIRDSHALGGRTGYKTSLYELMKIKASRERVTDEKQIKKVSRAIEKLIAMIPQKVSPKEFTLGFKKLFAELASPRGKDQAILFDQALIKRVTGLCEEYSILSTPEMSDTAASKWLLKQIEQLRIKPPGSSCGKILLTDSSTNGFSGRNRIFFTGLNHSAIPGKPSSEPILNNALRIALSKKGFALLTNEDQRLARFANLHISLSSIPVDSEVYLSASEFEQDGRTASFSQPFIQIVKKISGNDEVELEDLRNTKLLPIYDFKASHIDKAIDLKDFLSNTNFDSARLHSKEEALEKIIPSLNRFNKAAIDRVSSNSSTYLGMKNWDPEKFDFRVNGKSVSVSFLNSLDGCKFSHFLSRIIKCMPYDQVTWEPATEEKWLDHFQRGELLHEIFEKFLRKANWPINKSDFALLQSISQEAIEKFAALFPPADQTLYLKEKEDILADANFFFEQELKNTASMFKPVGFEVAFGMKGSEEPDGMQLSSEDPIPLELADGTRLQLRGLIDRVDLGPDGLRIIDYKTGRSEKYKPDGEYFEHSELQLAIYFIAAKELAKRANVSHNIVESGLYFPTERGEGVYLPFNSSDTGGLFDSELSEKLAFFREGKFEEEVSDENCTFCNAKNLCPYRTMIIPLQYRKQLAEEQEGEE